MENIKINQEDVTTLIYLIENKIENLEGLIESLEKRKMVPGVVEINKETVLNLTRILNNLKK